MGFFKDMTPERKTILMNAALAGAYTFLGAQSFGLDDLSVSGLFALGVAMLRGLLGVVMDKKGETLPMDQRTPAPVPVVTEVVTEPEPVATEVPEPVVPSWQDGDDG